MIKSSKWRYKINIKSMFEETTTPELIVRLCSTLIVQLKNIKSSSAKDIIIEDEKAYIQNELEELIDHFEFVNYPRINSWASLLGSNKSEGSKD